MTTSKSTAKKADSKDNKASAKADVKDNSADGGGQSQSEKAAEVEKTSQRANEGTDTSEAQGPVDVTSPDAQGSDGDQKSGDSGDGEQRDTPGGPFTDAFPGNTGPMTGTPAPPESSYRMPDRAVDVQGAPLDPPRDAATQTVPEQGYNLSSTNHVYAEAGGTTVAGEDHKGLTDADGNEVSTDDLFEDNPSQTFVTAKMRVYEEFVYPNTTETARRLLFVKGQRIPRAQAERIKAAEAVAPPVGQDSEFLTSANHRGDSNTR